jgi:hypothetical protein
METLQFACSICGDASRDICVYCTKDACANHICERCHRCSDCCHCDIRMEMDVTREHESASHQAPDHEPEAPFANSSPSDSEPNPQQS